jgi:hypothetical protein
MIAELRAEELVQVVASQPGWIWKVQLSGLRTEPLTICEHVNPAVVRDQAKRVQAYLAALIREATGTSAGLRLYVQPLSVKGDDHELDDDERTVEGIQRPSQGEVGQTH